MALGTSLLGAASSSCVDRTRSSPPPAARGDVAVWDFAQPPPTVTSSLWPAGPSTPVRIKQHLKTNQRAGHLLAQVAGIDPYFYWQLAKPTFVGAFRIEIDCAQPADLQLFWAGTTCRSFDELCSSHAHLDEGTQHFTFVLPPEPLRELRLDFTQTMDHRFEILRLELLAEARSDTGWKSMRPETRAHPVEGALQIGATDHDPWLETEVPQLDAALVDTVEIVSGGPLGGPAQLFWRGEECPRWDERCSLLLSSPPTASVLTGGWTALSESPTWRGRIDGLRLDPGSEPGTYRLQRLALLRIEAGD